MEKRGGVAMIPTKRNRRIQLPVDPAIYALENMVARCGLLALILKIAMPKAGILLSTQHGM
jgi:hypothetical protein